MNEQPIHDLQLVKYVQNHKYFWWWVPENKLPFLSFNSIVEASLNYGDVADIRDLFRLIGVEQVAEIFYQATLQIDGKKRINYHQRTLHFFDLYFKRHVPEYFNKRTKRIATTYY